MSNTVIQLKYSDVTSAPITLNTAEPAYSNSSNKLYIGQSDGSVVAIGGKYYTALVDAATSANTASTIVKRDNNNNFTAGTITANLSGNATSATTLQTARNVLISGTDITSNTVSFDGSAGILLNANLSATGVSAGTYGGSTQIPTFVVDTKGRLTSAGNVAIATAATTLNVAGDSGTGSLALLTDTLTINGRDGLTSIFVDANNSVLIDVDNTVLRTTGNQTITGDLSVTGNLVVSGNTITQDVETLVVEDSLIQLAANNAGDGIDIGLFGQYVSSGTKYTALFRDASDSGKYKFLTAGTEKPLAANTVNVAAFSTATLVATIESDSVTIKGINILDKANNAYDTANTAQTTGQAAFNQANTSSTTAAAAFTQANGAYSQANTATTSAAAAFTQANTAATTAQAAFNQANTDVTSISTSAGDYGSASIIPVLTLAANGRVSAVTNTSIAIGASAITSGTLGVARGGTGNTTFTNNGVLLGQGTSAITTVYSSTEGHILQINSSGVPVFGVLNGGSF